MRSPNGEFLLHELVSVWTGERSPVMPAKR